MLVITGPSGVGKTHLASKLVRLYPDKFDIGKLCTTRHSRPDENDSDRVFIDENTFKQKKIAGEFTVSGKFHNNWYGYPKDIFKPKNKHIIINTWPALLPKFLSVPSTLIIGLSVKNDIGLLKSRMQNRGDSPKNIAERLPLIKKDIKDLQIISSGLRDKDRLFTIKTDSSLAEDVIPYIENILDL